MQTILKTLLFSTLITLTLPFSAAHSQTLGGTRKPESIQVQPDTTPQKLTQANLIAETVKSSVVRVILGCKAKAYSAKTGKIYDFNEIIGFGSGYARKFKWLYRYQCSRYRFKYERMPRIS